MTGSRRMLEALHTMLSCYPMRAEISATHIVTQPRGGIVVRLCEAEPTVVAAGLVEWQRTLGNSEIWAWRAPNGQDLHIAVTGCGTECAETPIAVLAGPIPYDRRLDVDLDPDCSARLSTETLYDWLGAEILRTWPFNIQQLGVDK